jgi:hypothetical protein
MRMAQTKAVNFEAFNIVFSTRLHSGRFFWPRPLMRNIVKKRANMRRYLLLQNRDISFLH